MGNNGKPKKRGLTHYLYEQWKATKGGKEEHKRIVEEQARRKPRPKVVAATRVTTESYTKSSSQ